MGCAMVRFAIYNDPPQEMPKIMLLYIKACQEHIDAPQISQERDLFLKEWMKPESHDIFTFSNRDMKKLSRRFGELNAKWAREATKKDIDMSDVDMNKMSLEEKVDPYKLLGDSLAAWERDGTKGATTEERANTWLDHLIDAVLTESMRLLEEDPTEENMAKVEQILGFSDTVADNKRIDAMLTNMGKLNVN